MSGTETVTDNSDATSRPEEGLEVPDGYIAQLTFAATDTAAIRAWVGALPLVNTSETAAQLRTATAELAALDAPVAAKFEMIEAIRPVVHYIANRLDRLSQTRLKVDEDGLTLTLLSNLCVAYQGTLAAALASPDRSIGRELLVGLLHRTISDTTRRLVRSLQYYHSVPIGFWRQLNLLYRIALDRGLEDAVYPDEENTVVEHCSVRCSYLRALLMASARPNKLAPQQLGTLFTALEHWTQSAALDRGTDSALLIVDLAADHGPRPARFTPTPADPWTLRTEVLAYEIDAYLKGVDGTLPIPPAMTPRLLRHLVQAWSLQTTRAFQRTATDAPMRVCVGLRAIHYFLAGATEFSDQIANTDALLRREVNPFLELDYETSGPQHKPQRDHVSNYLHFEAQAFDTSPEGYCIEWFETLPDNAQVGELIALREEGDARWRIGIIRWIHQGEQRSTSDFQSSLRMGIELLGPRAIPVALRAIRTTGGPTAFSRALLLPKLEAINQPATLVAPSLPFSRMDKVHIHRQGLQTTAQLLDVRLTTDSVTQFTYRMLDGYLETVRSSSTIDHLSAMTKEDSTQGP